MTTTAIPTGVVDHRVGRPAPVQGYAGATTMTATTMTATVTTVSSTDFAMDFAAYVASRRTSLMTAALAISRDRYSAEDLLQTALANVYPQWARIRDWRAADVYVRRAMVNQHISWFRQKWRTNERVTHDLPDRADAWDHDPGHVWDRRSDRGELWPFVTALPPRQRAVVVLRYYEDLSVAETARVLRCSIGTVKSQTSDGLAKLRRMAGEAGFASTRGFSSEEAKARTS